MSSTYVQSEAEERAKIAIFAAFDEKPPEIGFLKTYSVTNCFKIESDKGQCQEKSPKKASNGTLSRDCLQKLLN